MNSYKSWDDNLDKWPAPLPDFPIVPQETALLIVDMQKYFCDPELGVGKVLQKDYPDMAAYFQEELRQRVVPNAKRLLDLFRKNKLRIIHLTVGPELKDGGDLIERRRLRDQERKMKSGLSNLCYAGSLPHEIIDELKPLADEFVLNKNSSGAFNSTAIDQYLRNFRIKTLIICAIATNICVDLTARDASDRGYNVLLVEDACASYEKLLHDATLRTFARVFGRVAKTEVIIKEVEGEKA